LGAGDIAYGQTKRIEYSVILKEVGKHTFRTRIRADGVKLEKTATVEVGEPNLDVIVVGPRTRVIGRQARYTITVVNTGTASLTGVKLSDELTPEIVFLGSNGGRLDGDLVRWDLGTIAPGSKKTVSVDVRSSIAGTFKNVCTAVADRGLREQGKTITQFTPASSLAVEIDRDTASLAVGMETTFVVRRGEHRQRERREGASGRATRRGFGSHRGTRSRQAGGGRRTNPLRRD
jgi:uncharacterized repeat protein (TIGR01451 family)